jgi:hypothetical protein
VRTVVVERFAEPSRRCEPIDIDNPSDDVVVWDLPDPRGDKRALVRSMYAALPHWLDGRLPVPERRQLLRACLQTQGARLGALAAGPELLMQLRDGQFEKLACYSAKDFPLLSFLASYTRCRPEEMLARGTKYFGEFAFELLAVIPYAYWLHRQGSLSFTVSTADTSCLYYFSPRHEERGRRRGYVPITEYPIGRPGAIRYDHKGFPITLDTSKWLPPPYRAVYRDERFRWPKDTCVVYNKTSDERYLHRGFSVNTMDTGLVLAVIGRLRQRYQVVYVRPRAEDIVGDHQAIRETGDLEAVERAYPDVLTIQQLHEQHPDLTFNELQLRVLSGAERFVSVLGGGSYLASYFGGTNVVYARRGWEVSAIAFDNWFHLFSGARVVAASTPRELMRTIERELLVAPEPGSEVRIASRL